MVLTALGEVGVKEVGCANCGPEVETYLSSVMLPKGYPWCSGFVHFCFRKCGTVLTPERKFAAAAQFATKNEVFRKGQLDDYDPLGPGHEWERISEDGDVGLLYYSKLGRIGHCFIVYGETEDYLLSVEGNTSEDGGREGTTVRKRKRLKSTIHSIHRW